MLILSRYKSELVTIVFIGLLMVLTFTVIDTGVPFVEVFDNRVFQVGMLFGIGIAALGMVISSTTSAYFGKGFGLRQPEIDQLHNKMKKSGYSAYTTLSLTGKLKLDDGLTHKELTYITLANLIIFDSEGSCLTPVVPLSVCENDDKPQRPKLRLINGGKD